MAEQAQISVLDFPDNVRMRRGMYLPSIDHCINEALDNSRDEASAGRCSIITTAIIDREVIVEDNGGGIPIGYSKTPGYEDKRQIELAIGSLHAGGKFSSQDGYTTNTSGLNGVGISCVNATSDFFKAVVRTNGKEYAIEYSKGLLTKPLYETGEQIEKDVTGTEIHFIPDSDIWQDEWFDFTELNKHIKRLAYLNPGLTLNYYVDSVDKDNNPVKIDESYCYPEGLIGYVKESIANKTPILEPISFSKTSQYIIKFNNENIERNVDIDIAMSYIETFSPNIKSFVNDVITIYGGDHETGFKAGLFNAIRKYALEYNHIKEASQITSDDCQEGLTAIVSVKLKDPVFEGQGKGRLRMKNIYSSVKETIEEYIYDFLSQDKNRSSLIIEKVLKAAKAREAARKARDTARGVKAIDSGHVEGLADCSSKNPEECMLFIVEGKKQSCSL